jgi:hypothetical protein
MFRLSKSAICCRAYRSSSSSSSRVVGSATPIANASFSLQRRRFFDDSNVVDVKKPVKPPIFEDVQPSRPASPLPRKPRQAFSSLGPLSQPLTHAPQHSKSSPTQHATEHSLLGNGVRVVSQNTVDRGAVVGVVVDCGTRHESDSERGSTLMVAERLAFAVRRSLFLFV